jgi:predicted MFS family arabinose efflux permease
MLLWTTQVVSTVGTRVSGLALPLLVLALTDSPTQAGLVGAAETVPYLLFALPAGAFVDRWNRRAVMLTCELARAAAVAALAAAVLVGNAGLLLMLVVAFVDGTFFIVFDVAEGAALPHLVDPRHLTIALAHNQARTQAGDLVGKPLGGALFSVTQWLPFLVDAVSYAISFAALLAIRRPFQHERVGGTTRIRADIAEGLRWVAGESFLRAAVCLMGGMNFVFTALELVVLVRAREMGASSTLIGVILAFSGVTGVLGSLAAPAVQRLLGPRQVIRISAWVWTALVAGLALLPNPYSLGVESAAVFGLIPVFNVVLGNHIYAVMPDSLLGRVRSAIRVVALSTNPLGAAAGGALAGALHARTSFTVLAAAMLLVAVGTVLARGIRQMPSEHPDKEPVVSATSRHRYPRLRPQRRTRAE